MYEFYLAGVRLPVTPSAIQTSMKSRNKTVNLINDGEINLLKSPGLMELSFDALLPQAGYPFSVSDNYSEPSDILKLLEELKRDKRKFRFIVVRVSPSGGALFDTNLRASLEEYTIKEDAKNGLDLVVTIKLKEYRDFGTRTVQVVQTAPVPLAARERDSIQKQRTYTVAKGDCLWNIAQAKLGNGSRYTEIYKLNKAAIDARNKGTGNPRYTIYGGQVFNLPD